MTTDVDPDSPASSCSCATRPAWSRVDDDSVTCPWHAWCFRLSDGKMTLGYGSVDAFDVRVEGDEVQVSTLPRPAAA